MKITGITAGTGYRERWNWKDPALRRVLVIANVGTGRIWMKENKTIVP
jgi:hypothetical protein